MALVAKCALCGRVDERHEWKSADDAAKEGVFQSWTCPTCAWTEMELVEHVPAEQEAEVPA